MAQTPLISRTLREKLKGNDENSTRYKAVSLLERHPGLAGLAATAPMLLEEGRASARGIKLMRDFYKHKGEAHALRKALGEGKDKLLPAYMTYLGQAAGTAGTIELGGALMKKHPSTEHHKEEIAKKASEIIDNWLK